jgi:hypothetical protein
MPIPFSLRGIITADAAEAVGRDSHQGNNDWHKSDIRSRGELSASLQMDSPRNSMTSPFSGVKDKM